MKRILCFLVAVALLSPYVIAVAANTNPNNVSQEELVNRDKEDNSVAPNTAENLKKTLTVANASTQMLKYLDDTTVTFKEMKGVTDIKSSYIRDYLKGMMVYDWVLGNTYNKEAVSEAVILPEVLGTYSQTLKEFQEDLMKKSSTYTEYNLENGKPKLQDMFTLDGTKPYSDFGDTVGSNKHGPLNDVKLLVVNYFENSILTLFAKSIPVDTEKMKTVTTVTELNDVILESVKETPNGTARVNEDEEGNKDLALLRTLFSKAEQESGVSLRALYNEYKNIELFMRTLANTKLEDSSVTVTTPLGYNVDDYLKVGSVVSAYFAFVEESSSSGTVTQKPNTPIVTDTTDILSLMTNARIVGNDIQLLSGNEGELTELGYAIVAAGVVNDPFVSLAGNDLFNSTVLEHVKDKKSEVSSILETAINTKKPLYVTSTRDKSFLSATDFSIDLADYRIAMLSDMLDYEKSPVKAFALVRGSMQTSKVDSTQMEYVRGNKIAPTNETLTSTEVTVEDESTESNEDTATVELQDKSQAQQSSNENITVGSATISGTSSMMTKPVAYYAGQQVNMVKGSMFGGGINSGDTSVGVPYLWGSTTAALLRNAQLDVKNSRHLKNASKQMLFMNGLGDIVLEDNTIILPAIANPTFYKHKDEKPELEEVGKPNLMAGDGMEFRQKNEGTYYPFTVAFFNHYPDVGVYNGKNISTANPNDKNKWVLVNAPSGYGYKELKNVGAGTTNIKYGFLDYSLTMAVDSLRVTADDKLGYTGFRIFELEQDRVGLFERITNSKNLTMGRFRYFVKQQPLTTDGLPLFPINYSAGDSVDQYLNIAGALTTSALRYISVKDTGSSTLKSSGVFRTDFFVRECIAECRRGTQYASTIVKNMKVSYDEIVADTGSRILKMFTSFADSAVRTLGKIEGVLAIRNVYENPFLNSIAQFLNEYYVFIAVALVAVIASKFLAGHINFPYLIFMCVMIIAGFEVYTQWMPTVVPSMYNMIVNDVMEDVTWNTIFNNSERYSELLSEEGDRSFDGAEKPYTATITLYTLNNEDMKTISEKLGVSKSMIQAGRLVPIDELGGVFLQGNQIKMSIDALLLNNSVRGLYASQWQELLEGGEEAISDDLKPVDAELNKNPYVLKYDRHYKGLDSYYTPYHKIQEQFMETLNKFTNIFTMERNTFSYGRSIYKDAFVVNKFTNSGIFLAPGDDEVIRMNINDKNITGEPYDVDKVIAYVHELFDPQEDWLNLRPIFEEPDEEFIDSLWGAMLVKQGYYDIDFTYNEKQAERISRLIDYINTQTKLWVIENEKNLNFISDDNAIKLISLYATTCFNHKVSQPSYWLYPVYANSQDITLEDVLYGTMTTILDRNSAVDGTVVNTVALSNGIFGVIFVILILVIAALFVFIVTYLVPILYLLFGVLFVLKLMKTDSSIPLLRGYFKVTLITAVLYTVFSLSFRFIEVGGYKWYGFFGCAIVISCCLYVLAITVYSVVMDIFNLGDNTLNANLKSIVSTILSGVSGGRIVAERALHRGRNTAAQYGARFQQYMHGERIDTIDAPTSHRQSVFGGRTSNRADYTRADTMRRNRSNGTEEYDFNSSIDDIGHRH